MNASPFLKAVVFDWAGTVVDFGSRAPMGAFVEAFKRFDVPITIADARKPMGLPKRAHVEALLADPVIRERWREAKGYAPGDADIDALMWVFVPLNISVVADYADMIPGALNVIARLRSRGLKIGSTTGYTREIMERLAPIAASAGYEPDNMVCAGDLADGRPTPLMMYRCFADLGVYPPAAVVKVDDTIPGIAEGVAAGTWTVGVALSGNACGLSLDELNALSDAERAERRATATAELNAAAPDFIIDSVADLLPVIEEIERRCAAGEMPGQKAKT